MFWGMKQFQFEVLGTNVGSFVELPHSPTHRGFLDHMAMAFNFFSCLFSGYLSFCPFSLSFFSLLYFGCLADGVVFVGSRIVSLVFYEVSFLFCMFIPSFDADLQLLIYNAKMGSVFH